MNREKETWEIPGLSTLNVTLSGSTYTLNILDYVGINKSLIEECTNYASDLAFLESVKAAEETKLAKLSFEFVNVKSKKFNEIQSKMAKRDKTVKVTAVKNEVDANVEVQSWELQLIEQTEVVNILKGWLNALNKKKSMIEKLVDLEIRGLSAEGVGKEYNNE